MKLGAFSVSLTVKDIEKSKEFYEKIGFIQIGGVQAQGWLILRNGDHTIGLFQGMFDSNLMTFNPGWDIDCNELDEFDDVRALLAKANAFIALADLERCVATYKEILEREKEFPSHQTGVYLDYPYLVATQKIENEFASALDVLKEHIDRLTFPLDYFKWHASRALIINDGVEANKALDAAKVKRSGFRFHQDVGLVGKEHEKTIKQLCKVSM